MPEPKIIYRYPAVNPFSEEQSMLFFGRSAETQRLASLIFSEKLTVLYGKSGYGKSSLLNAGILPRLREENALGKRRYLPVSVRFQTAEKDGQTLFDKFRFHWKLAMEKAAVPPAPLSLPGLPDTLWGLFKTIDLQAFASEDSNVGRVQNPADVSGSQPVNVGRVQNPADVSGSQPVTVVLLFDQFEEFFSYPAEQQAQFREQLSELLYTTYPAFLRENRHSTPRPPEGGEDAVADWLGRDLDVRAVFAIREDRLSDLDSLSDRLPDILRKRMQLSALDEQQARAAIVRPAAFGNEPDEQALLNKAGLGFHSPAFAYDPAAVSRIVRELSGAEAQRIESFMLQIVCFSIEKNKVVKERLERIGTADLPDFETVYDDYYQSQIEEISDPALRQTARRLLEFGLLFVDANIGDAHRRSVDSLELAQTYGATPALLDALEKTYLIRREVNSFNRFSYEISHDTLMKPVLKSRRAAEEVEARRKIAAEKADAERRRRRAVVSSVVALLLISIMALLAVVAFLQRQSAVGAIQLADEKTRAAAVSDSLAREKTLAAEEAQARADANEHQAKRNEEIARLEKKKALNEREKATLLKLKAEMLLEASRYLAAQKFPENFDVFIYNDSLNFSGWGWENRELPAEVGKLKNLKSLDLSRNSMETLPAEIGKLQNLKSLDLSYNYFNILPAEIGKLQNLQVLDLVSNSLTFLPIEIGTLQNLQGLNLSENDLTDLPAEIGMLQNLQWLNLMNNKKLTDLPAEIGKLQNLQWLNLVNDSLTDLPAEIGKLQNLQWLYLSSNKLTFLPAEIGMLQNLQWLDLSNNKLTDLPAEIGMLQNLQYLGLGYDSLMKLPAEIGMLQNLQKLHLYATKLTDLPPEIGKLQNLQELELSSNKLTSLPAEIGNLQNLQKLDLSRNKLTSLPAEIGKLQNLQELDLGGNLLTALPIEILSKMPTLKKLVLGYGNGIYNSNSFPASTITDLRAAMPWCEIVWE